MSQFPVLLAGNRLTASLLTSALPLEAVKGADQSVTSSTVLVNDTALTIPNLVAGATYKFSCVLDYEGGTQGSSDIKWTWTTPASATLRYQGVRTTTAGAAATGLEVTGSATVTAGTGGAASLFGASMWGTLVMSSTPGALTLMWAQNTSSGTPTIVHAQSYLELLRTA